MKDFFLALGMAAALASNAIPASAQMTTATSPAATVVKKGTEIDGVLQQALSSKTNHSGDKFSLTLHDGFWHKNPPALKGTTLVGHLENVTPAGPTHKATMTVIADGFMTPGGSLLPIHAKLISLSVFEPHTHTIRDAGIIFGAAVAGHMVAGKNHGGLAGAAAGVALVSTLKSDIVVKQGTLVKLKLTEDLPVPAAP